MLVYGFGERENRLDFDALIEATLAAEPDLVYFAIYWNQSHIVAHRLRDKGLAATFLGSDALKPYAFLEVPSLDTVKPYHTLAGVDMRIKPSARPFLEAFAQRYPVMLAAPQYAAEAYDCAAIILEAIRRVPTGTRARVLEQMEHLRSFSGALGDIRFDEHGDLIDPEIGLYQCIDGQRKYLGVVKDLVAAVCHYKRIQRRFVIMATKQSQDILTGSKEATYLTRTTAEGRELRLPVGIIHGARVGEQITVYGGQHGTEYAGIEAVQRLYRELDPADVRGVLVISLATNEDSLLNWREIELSCFSPCRRGCGYRSCSVFAATMSSWAPTPKPVRTFGAQEKVERTAARHYAKTLLPRCAHG